MRSICCTSCGSFIICSMAPWITGDWGRGTLTPSGRRRVTDLHSSSGSPARDYQTGRLGSSVVITHTHTHTHGMEPRLQLMEWNRDCRTPASFAAFPQDCPSVSPSPPEAWPGSLGASGWEDEEWSERWHVRVWFTSRGSAHRWSTAGCTNGREREEEKG